MGTTVYYRLSLPISCARISVPARLEALWRQIPVVPLLELTRLFHYTGEECGPDGTTMWCHPGGLLKIQASAHLEAADDRERLISIEPLEIIGFVAWVGSRVEPLTLGLARYPATLHFGGTDVPTGLDGWQWHASCKTHYARLLGQEHFAACHQAVIAALDLARDTGFVVSVRDESGYAESRDARLLDSPPGTVEAHGRAGPEPALV